MASNHTATKSFRALEVGEGVRGGGGLGRFRSLIRVGNNGLFMP